MRAALCSLWICCWPCVAAAGNQDGIALGNDASMSGMAVTANTDDASAAWYNPAGLASMDRRDVTMACSAYGLRVNDVPDGYRTHYGASVYRAALRSRSFLAVPSAFVFARRLSARVTGAFSFFVPRQQSSSYAESLRDLQGSVFQLGTSWRSDQRFELAFESVRYMVGPALGASLPKGISIGGALYLAHRLERRDLRLWSRSLQQGEDALGQRGGTLFEELRQRESSRTWGLQGVVGLQLRYAERYRVGLTVRTPTLQLARRADAGLEEIRTLGYDGASTSSELSFPPAGEGRRARLALVSPLRVHLGVARYFANVWLSGELSLQPALGDRASPAYARPVWNARVGAMFRLSSWIGLGAGAFTDNAGAEVLQFQPDVDYYGVTFGVRLRSRATPRWPRAEQERDVRKRLSIATVLSLRYALGVGRAPVVVLDHGTRPAAGDASALAARVLPVRLEATDVTWHQVSLHLGSLIKF